jgi:hypothetical protein
MGHTAFDLYSPTLAEQVLRDGLAKRVFVQGVGVVHSLTHSRRGVRLVTLHEPDLLSSIEGCFDSKHVSVSAAVVFPSLQQVFVLSSSTHTHNDAVKSANPGVTTKIRGEKCVSV